MNAEGAALQGSGWVVCTLCAVLSGLWNLNTHLFVFQWLALDKEAKKLSVETTANQVMCNAIYFIRIQSSMQSSLITASYSSKLSQSLNYSRIKKAKNKEVYITGKAALPLCCTLAHFRTSPTPMC
jgi:hypothetical protein